MGLAIVWRPFGDPTYKKRENDPNKNGVEIAESRIKHHVSQTFRWVKYAKSCTRNEKVACSSQVTSSKSPGTVMVLGLFSLLFQGIHFWKIRWCYFENSAENFWEACEIFSSGSVLY